MATTLWTAPNSSAFIFVPISPSFPPITPVGTTFPAALGLNNSSTPPESTTFPVLTISDIRLYPSCTTPITDCGAGIAEPGVYALSPTGVGDDGPTCTGIWMITPNTGNPATATYYQFIPPGGEGTLQLATGETCSVNFTATTLKVPANDALPDPVTNPGVQTFHATGGTVDPDGPGGLPPFGRRGDATLSTGAHRPERGPGHLQHHPRARTR
ncbi:MAG: hypothetical protein LC733_13390 [Actinobacteria bacterium]|nr:hypothetical protein [Actinomycetota bacterium]